MANKRMRDNIELLSAPFPIESVSWRVGATNNDKTRGLALAYLTARDVMDRLDDVVSQLGWSDCYRVEGSRTFCSIMIRDDENVSHPGYMKEDVAGDTGVEADKGSVSDAFKRAAVKWGIGRYLYRFPPTWVQIEPAGNSFKIKDSELPKLRKILEMISLDSSTTEKKLEATEEKAPKKTSDIGHRLLDAMVVRCKETGTEVSKAPRILNEIIKKLGIKKDKNFLESYEGSISGAIMAWRPDPFVDGPAEGSEAANKALPGTYGAHPSAMRRLHQWAKDELRCPTEEAHRILHQAIFKIKNLAMDITSLTDLNIAFESQLKEAAIEIVRKERTPIGEDESLEDQRENL